MARRFYLTILTLAGVCLATCGFVQELAAQQEPGRVRDAKNGFSFVPPPGWERSTKFPSPQVRLMFFGPIQQSFRANLNLIVDKDGGEPFEDVSKQVKEVSPRMLTRWKLEEEGGVEIGGKQAYCMSSTYRMAGHSLRNVQFFVRGGNGKAYTLTFTTLSDGFEDVKLAIAESAMSIRIE